MKKSNPCQCQSTCQTKRCTCLKEGRPCGLECRCQNCSNPFNKVANAEQLSDCARDHIQQVLALPTEALDKQYDLPCRCASIPLKDLLQNYTCQRCNEPYYYSFCFDGVMDTSSIWHCSVCGTCSDDGVWHCKRCNTCSYGLTLRCEHCGKKSS